MVVKAPLRIAIVAACPFPLPRGTPVRILRMAEALAERGHEVHVATYHLGSGKAAGVRIHRTRELRSYRKLGPGPSYRKLLIMDPLLVRCLRKLLREASFDVIHAHHYEGLLVGAAARGRRGIPLVYDAHTLLTSELPFYRLGLPRWFKRSLGVWMDCRIPRLADHTVSVTDTIRDKLLRNDALDARRITVVSNGVELDHFDPAKHPSPPGATPRLIFTGNLAEYQGIDVMLRAFAIVLQRVPEARLRIASDSPFDFYEALVGELGIRDSIDILPSPRFEELPAVLAAGGIAVNPRSDGDGIPVKLLNYMAAGRPVVSFDSSAPGVVHGETGWLVRSGDEAALAEGMVRLLQDPQLAERLGAAARGYVIENCRWSIVAERCEAIYRSLLEEHSTTVETRA